MAMRILAVLAEARTAEACLEGAWAAAQVDPDTVIEALHVKVDPDKLVGASEEIAIQRLRERNEGTAEDRARAVKAVFDRWVGDHLPAATNRVQWVGKVGSEQDVVLQEARSANLTVLARPYDLDAHDAMHVLVYDADRPLLVPAGWRATGSAGFATHMAIAWKSTPQARQAVEGARPWLRAAKQVTIITVTENDGQDVFDIDALMREMGVTVSHVATAAQRGVVLATQILNAVHDVHADALVIGAYRHSELIEWALGSTTQELLAAAEVPIFLAH
jgi:nucleotide-binding universal stress UspA family protein